MTKPTPADMIRTAAAAYIAEPSSESDLNFRETWNACAKKLKPQVLLQIIDELQSDKSKIEITEPYLALIKNYDGYDRIICGAGDSIIVCAPEVWGGRRVVGIWTRAELQISYEREERRALASN